jgi:hypothetical protein
MSGGGRASALSMRNMKNTLSDIFGEEQTKPSSVRSQPHRVAKIKSQTERASRAEKKAQKETTKKNVSMLDDLFKSLKV